MSQFTETIRSAFGVDGYKKPVGSKMSVGVVHDELPDDPYHEYEASLCISSKTSVKARPSEKPQIIEDQILARITSEVYGDVRVRLDEYIRDRAIADEPREELEAIVEMMR